MKYTGPAKPLPTRTLASLLNYREAFVLTLIYLVCLIVLNTVSNIIKENER